MPLNYSFFADQGETPATLQERRLRAAQLASQIGQGNTYGSGVGDLFRGLGVGLSRYRTNKAQQAGDASAKSGMDRLMETLYAPKPSPIASNDDASGGMPMVPQLATYTPPQEAPGPQNAGLPNTQPAPQMAAQSIPEPAPMQPAELPQAAQMQPAGNDAALIPQIMEVLRNPFISEQDRAFLQQRLEDIQKKQDPAYQMELEKSQLELEALRNPGPDYEIINGKDGSVFRVDKRTGKTDTLYGPQPDNFRPLTQEEAATYGLPPGGNYQIGPDNKVSEIGGGGTTVNIDQKAEGAFDKKLAEGQAEAFNTMATEGLNARADLGIIGELESSLADNGGTMSGIAGIAAKYGVGGEGMSDIQAANALINKLVPTQRQPGSGSMSDRDVELFKGSLPSLWNAPGGNAKIIHVMRGLAAYKQAQGDIADQVMMGEISRQEARKMLRELPNPLARENFAKPAADLKKKYGLE